MVLKVDYKELKDGYLNPAQKSSILAQFTLKSKDEWQSLRQAILNSNKITIFNSCQFVQEVSSYFNFDQVLAIKHEIDEKAQSDAYDINLYYQMINEWSRQICNLRSGLYKSFKQINLAS